MWRSGKDLHGSYPDVAGNANLDWAGNGTLTFLSEADNWPHLYAVPAAGGAAKLLTPGAFMVEHMARSRDGRSIVYSANTGAAPMTTSAGTSTASRSRAALRRRSPPA